MIERAVNSYGQEQKINNLDAIIKIGDKFLQVRLIQTEKWKRKGVFHMPMPRAKFVHPEESERISYIIDKADLIQLKKRKDT